MAYLDVLREHGEKKAKYLYSQSLNNALKLAKACLPLVVVLKEPCNIADTVPYNVMVYGDETAYTWGPERVGSATLQEIDSLTESASNDKCGLGDLSVFDLNTLLSKDIQDEMEEPGLDVELEAELEEAHGVFWDMMLAKRPKAILVLTTAAGHSKHGSVKHLGSSLRKAGTTKNFVLWSQGRRHNSVIIYGFHPSVYLREDYVSDSEWSLEETHLANDVIRVCFGIAFEVSCNMSRNSGKDDVILERWRALLRRRRSSDIETDLGRLSIGS